MAQTPRKETKEYSEGEVLYLIRSYRPKHRDRTGETILGRDHTAQKAWSEIKRCRAAYAVDHLVYFLLKIANAPDDIERGTSSRDKPGSLNRREVVRILQQVEETDNLIEWTMRHPWFEFSERVTKFDGRFGYRFLRRPTWWEKFEHDESQVVVPRKSGQWVTIATDATPFYDLPSRLRRFANLVRSYNLGRRARLRVEHRVADSTRLFVLGLQNSGPRHLCEAVDVLTPIYEAIGRPKPTYRSLYDLVRRLPPDSPLRDLDIKHPFPGATGQPIITDLLFSDDMERVLFPHASATHTHR